jgi:hypothetical protein
LGVSSAALVTDAAWSYDDDAGVFGGLGRAISRAARGVAKAVSKVPGVSVVTAPASLASDIARGRNVGASLVRAGRAVGRDVVRAAPVAATAASFFPGVGTGVAAGLNAAAALGRGETLRDAALAAARGAVPGGIAGRAAFDVAVGLAKGERIDRAALSAARGALPTPAARAAFDAGMTVVRERSRFVRGPGDLIRPGALASLVRTAAPAAVNIIGLSPSTARVAAALAATPALRAMPAAQLANRFGVNVGDALGAIASHAQAAQLGAKGLGPAPLLARRMPASLSLDAALSAVGSRARAPVGPMLPVVRVRRLTSALSARMASLPAFRGRASVVRMAADAAGLEGDGSVYRVERGDTPGGVAKKLTGDARRYTELFAANPSKRVVATTYGRNFATFSVGERIALPVSWRKNDAAPPVAPPVVVPVGTVPVTPPTATPTTLQVQGLLVLWATDTGRAVPSDYGRTAADVDGNATGTRYVLALDSFRVWSNGTRGTSLPLSGPLDDATYQALYQWNVERLAQLGRSVPSVGGGATTPGTGGGVVVPIPGGVPVVDLPGIVVVGDTPTSSGGATQTPVPPTTIPGTGGAAPPATIPGVGGDAIPNWKNGGGGGAPAPSTASSSSSGAGLIAALATVAAVLS